MNKKIFLESYLNDLSELVRPSSEIVDKLVKVANLIRENSTKGRKTLIFGNGGSAAIASHFSVDLTKNAGFKCQNFNESDLITCFSNDYGFENWIAKAIEFYGNPGDLLILISSSGKSKNMIKGANSAKRKDFSSIITFSGFEKGNPLSTAGDINFWIDSVAYNFIENIHQIWLLSIVDLLIGSREYSA